MKVATMNSNIITIPFPSMNAAWNFSCEADLNQFGLVRQEDGTISLSTPVTASLEEKIPGILHGARARAKPPEKPKPSGPDGSPDGTPPGGGTPGSTSVWQQTYTEARAA
jgi:hypothetical protein